MTFQGENYCSNLTFIRVSKLKKKISKWIIFPTYVSKSILTFISLQVDTNLTFWIWYFTTQYLYAKATIMRILIRNIWFQISSLLRNHSYFTLDSDFDGMLIYWKVNLQSFLYDSLISIFYFATFAKDCGESGKIFSESGKIENRNQWIV